jgi:SAM-dependent methyltransferase
MLKNVVNVDEARSWNGADGDHWTDFEEEYNASSKHHYRRLREAAAIAPGERVLDFGCGTGETTRDVARASGTGSALGLDLSTRMIERARQRAREEGLANVTFEESDAQIHDFTAASFDVAISRFGCMFFEDPVAAYANIGRAVRSGGRLAMLSWQPLGNQRWLQEIRGALAMGRDLPAPPPNERGPFGLATEDRIRQVLSDAGWTDIEVTESREPMHFGPSSDHAYRLFERNSLTVGLSQGLDDAQKAQMHESLRAMLRSHETANGVEIDSRAWLITARRP